MICREGKISLSSFLLSLTVQVFSVSEYGEKVGLLISESLFTSIVALIAAYFVVLLFIIVVTFRLEDLQVAIRAAFLGYLLGISLYVALNLDDVYKPFGIYGAFLTIFHYSEYLVISISNPQSLSLDSFMLNHSIQYATFAVLSWTEFFVEGYFYPEMKSFKVLWVAGALVCLSGEIVRKLAILTAKKSFHHIVQFQQADDHKLVTNGIYKLFRHPSYVGWFYWSLATQIILANPICFVFYIIASWIFFHDRIYMEEIALLNFFGDEYLKYRQTTPTGLPFIDGTASLEFFN